MKKTQWLSQLNAVDDRFVEQADPARPVPLRRRAKAMIALAACFAVLLGTGLALFYPLNTSAPSVSKYEGSAYYQVIDQLNELTFEKPKFQNNYERIISSLGDWIGSYTEYGRETYVVYEETYDMADGTSVGSAPTKENSYQEITDNQVQGITEADRIKRSDSAIYYLDGNTLKVYSIEKEASTLLGSYTPENTRYTDWQEFFLSEDCQTVTLLAEQYAPEQETCVRIVALDVSNPAAIRERACVTVSGSYLSARKTNGRLLLFTSYVLDRSDIDFDEEATFLPQIDSGNGAQSLPADAICLPETMNDARYTVVLSLDETTLNTVGSAAYLSYSDNVYVSHDRIYLTHVFADIQEAEDGSRTQNSFTEISCLCYDENGFTQDGDAVVRGYVKDQYSLDEFDGMLRVVTTTNARQIPKEYAEEYDDETVIMYNYSLITATGISNASLYCIDLTSWETVAQVIDFAPPHEEVQSVRFDGSSAYVCTSIEMSDPVFFFDLSDLSNITYKDTGTIPGFSTSLVQFGNGYLLGIGQGNYWQSFKVEIYEEADSTVRSVCAYEREDEVYYARDYKAYYIDREHQLLGIGITDYSYEEPTCYVVLYFDGYQLREMLSTPLNGQIEDMRGVYIDGYMYMFGEDDFVVQSLL